MTEESGEHIVAGCGELHIEICIKELEKLAQIPIIKSDPVVSYKETVTEKSSQICMAKSQNRHNRIYATAEPLGEELSKAIEEKEIDIQGDQKALINDLFEKYSWDKQDARKIWAFGPND